MKSAPRKYKRVLQLELNEISRPLIQSMIDGGELPTFKALTKNWHLYRTTSEAEYTNIEPWIQWVTAHTGKSFDAHGVFRLGDGTKLSHPQIWEILSKNNLESLILASMNTHRGATKGGVFFPDPWSKAEDVHPESLRGLFNFVSRRVQGHATSTLSFSDIVDGLRSIAGLTASPMTLARIARQVVRQKLRPDQAWRMAGFFDLLLADILNNLLKDPRYSFCTLFVNSIAHYQHHFWRNHAPHGFSDQVKAPDCAPTDDPIRWGYRNFDRMLAKILKSVNLDETLVLIASGLTQIPFQDHDGEGGWNYYRLRKHDAFARRVLGLPRDQVFPMMSRDWQIGPFDEPTIQRLESVLDHVRVGDERVFATSRAADGFLFMETAITRHVDSQEQVLSEGLAVGTFHEFFERVAVKSGHHSGVGYLWTSGSVPELDGLHTIPLAFLPDIALSALGLEARMSDGPRPSSKAQATEDTVNTNKNDRPNVRIPARDNDQPSL